MNTHQMNLQRVKERAGGIPASAILTTWRGVKGLQYYSIDWNDGRDHCQAWQSDELIEELGGLRVINKTFRQ
jgi:hypothetical protein